MEQQSTNVAFLSCHMTKILKHLKLSDEILNFLYSDENNPFQGDMMTVFKKIEEEEAKKVFAIMLYTGNRRSAEYIANVFKRFGERNISSLIEEFGRTQILTTFNEENSLIVKRGALRKIGTMGYPFGSKPSGLCLIILNELILEREALAYEYVFRQLGFVVKLEKTQTIQETMNLFKVEANKQNYLNLNMFVSIIITRGESQYFYGKNFKRFEWDKAPISELVSISEEKNCQIFRDKPKLHFFNILHEKVSEKTKKVKFELRGMFGREWLNHNPHTTIIHSESDYTDNIDSSSSGFSHFGKVLMHTIAQFACEENLDQILNRVMHSLEIEGSPISLQIIRHFCPFNIYFNPGI